MTFTCLIFFFFVEEVEVEFRMGWNHGTTTHILNSSYNHFLSLTRREINNKMGISIAELTRQTYL